tara:strand:+ start:7736 stop:8512 length:777 start_codon:yes stop_codon:yes gene_type:complete
MSAELNAMIEAAKAAGQIQMQNFGKGISAKHKSPGELVTSVDIDCEKKILSILQRDFANYNIWSEEMGEQDNESDYRWIIDPLDGTHNFFFGIPIFGVCIALEKKGKIESGAILLPVLNQLFTVERGKGAFKNEEKMSVSNRKANESMINLCRGVIKQPDGYEKFSAIRAKVFNTRTFGAASFSLPYLASGVIDAILEFDEKPGDFAAGWLMIEEAGGKFTKIDGSEFVMDDSPAQSYFASNGIFHNEIIEVLGSRET